jgi:hypothetical protein
LSRSETATPKMKFRSSLHPPPFSADSDGNYRARPIYVLMTHN